MRHWHMSRFVLVLSLSLVAVESARGQSPREVVTREPAYNGARADAPVPPTLHEKNEGGSDGKGLCVYTSMLINGRYQQVPDLTSGKGSDYWKWIKSRPGGSYPEKWAKDMAEYERRFGRKLPYSSYVGTDPAVLERVSKAGVPMGATMNTGLQYNWQKIAHMISLISFKVGGFACVVDNNFPGAYSWMSDKEFMRRQDGGKVWAMWWLRPAPPPAPVSGVGWGPLALVALAIAMPAGALAITRQTVNA